ncbi:GL19761 [Drosophila persimilis]|uniref:GL19761 n=1 Tax=Drosophila persimilis TaxID=7234 RepID=B4GYP9_DROPE|nr:GL19761 [Drosophila persimilis]
MEALEGTAWQEDNKCDAGGQSFRFDTDAVAADSALYTVHSASCTHITLCTLSVLCTLLQPVPVSVPVPVPDLGLGHWPQPAIAALATLETGGPASCHKVGKGKGWQHHLPESQRSAKQPLRLHGDYVPQSRLQTHFVRVEPVETVDCGMDVSMGVGNMTWPGVIPGTG